MAHLFQCDKCGKLSQPHTMQGRLILQEVRGGQTHVSYYNRKAEVCGECFSQLKTLMNRTDAQALPPAEVHITVAEDEYTVR